MTPKSERVIKLNFEGLIRCNTLIPFLSLALELFNVFSTLKHLKALSNNLYIYLIVNYRRTN
jgi:hypothetical protein